MSQSSITSILEKDALYLLALQEANSGLRIISRSNDEYENLRSPFNKNKTARPPAIIVPKDQGELVAAVKYCTSQEHPIPLTVRSGGHDLHGRYMSEDAVLLDVSQIDDIQVFPDRHTVTIGPGVQGLPLLQALDTHGLATAVGWCGRVSTVGWAAGGGYGVAHGVWGLGADNILGAKVITPGPEGKIVDTDDDPELLWAIRGAGLGNFGIISELRLKVYKRPKQLAGMIMFPLSEARSVLLDGLQRFSDEGRLPGNFNGEFMVGNTEGIGYSITFLWSWICDPDTDESLQMGWELVEEFKKFGTVLVNTVGESRLPNHLYSLIALKCMLTKGHLATMSTFHEFLDPLWRTGGHFLPNSAGISGLTPELIDLLVDNPPPATNFGSLTLFHHASHRAVESNPNSAYGIRQDHYIFAVTGGVSTTASVEDRKEAEKWTNELYNKIQKAGLSMSKGYYSFSRPEHADAVAYYGEDSVKRLRKLKQKYNPRNSLPYALPVL